jgi:hypothetical protein
MNYPAATIAYSLWLRLRWAAAGISLYLVGLAIAAQLFPNSGEPVVLAALLLTAAFAHMLHVFTLGPADLGVKGSGFPTCMLTLPLSTRALAGWPMLCGASAHAILWVIVVYAVLIPAGFSPPVFWPAAMIGAGTVWAQAISWSPFPTPFARVPVLAVAMTPLVLLGIWAGRFLESPDVSVAAAVGAVVWAGCGYWFGVRGLSRARCGNVSDWHGFLAKVVAARLPRYFGSVRLRSFRSATGSQLWHECRRNAVFLPAMIGFMGLPLLAMNCLGVLNGNAHNTLLFGSVSVTPAQMTLGIWLIVPLMAAATFGTSMGKLDLFGKDVMPSFFAIRPMTTTRFVALKLVATAITVIAAWAVIFALLTVWALVEASPLNARESLVRTAIQNLTLRQFALAVAVVIGLLFVTWRGIVNGMWPSLAGRKWVSSSIAVASLLGLTAAVVVGSWVYRHPEIQPRLEAGLPWVLGGLLATKFAVAAWALNDIGTLGLIERRSIIGLLVVWLVIAGGIVACIGGLVPISWQLAACVALFLPLARIAAAPAALHRNRHR